MPRPSDILLQDKDAVHLLSLFKKAGFEARCIGGSVRDALLGRPLKDIDIATASLPADTTALLEKNNIKAIPTGIDHGTVTAHINGRNFEITTLRADVATDGRHAQVAFTKDWEVDAQRRDFTINALSVDAQGVLHDYTDGLKDLESKELRFIGDAATRIKEDYLRILRYFRFASQLGWPLTNKQQLDVCDEQAEHLSKLSRERIQSELFKLLLGQGAGDIVSLMQKHGIWPGMLTKPVNVVPLKKLITLEEKHGETDALRRLLALIGFDNLDQIDRVTVLSNKEKKRIQDIVGLKAAHAAKRSMARQLYAHGPEVVKDFYYLRNDDSVFEIISQWQKPLFPVTGSDVMPLTNGEGPLVGVTLKALENYWLDNGFEPSKDQLIAMAKSFVEQEN